MMRSFIMHILLVYIRIVNLRDQIKKNKMGGGEVHTGFWWGNLREVDHLKTPGVDGTIILKRIFKKWDGGGGMDCIDMAQDRDRWWALVNAVMNLRVP
jgi:hypothetical protein